MTPVHDHPASVAALWDGPAQTCAAAAAIATAALYLLAARRLRRRGDAWPRRRDAAFTAGACASAWAVAADPHAGPLGGLVPGPFTAHMLQHLVIVMAAPLLVVLARPLTLTLRTLPPGRLRRALPAVTHAWPLRALLCPPVAAAVDIGGLWLLYGTGLYAATQHHPLLHAAVHAHVLAAGLLFTFAVCQVDPGRRRWSLAVRGAALLAAGAFHSVLAKSLYAAAPPGTSLTVTDLHSGALLMYYGGDLVEVALAAALAVQWYVVSGRAARVGVRPHHARRRRRLRSAAGGDPAAHEHTLT
ncbi:cytochrome c oxidase assembly protein [Streptomyces sp. enrichment culture]|uniref:cytochrome c oxidase assembly protein n=1 Tax=Streptomyces sp. enrichment culture TaxID=1795815 RepID=UPI003F56D326